MLRGAPTRQLQNTSSYRKYAVSEQNSNDLSFKKMYMGLPDMHMVPSLLCAILFIMSLFLIFALVGLVGVFNNTGTTHQMITYMGDIAEMTRDLKNGTEYVKRQIPVTTNISKVVGHAVSLNTTEWTTLEDNAKKTVAAGAHIVQSISSNDVFAETSKLFIATRTIMERPSFLYMVEKLEECIPKFMDMVYTQEAYDIYILVLDIMKRIPTLSDVIIPYLRPLFQKISEENTNDFAALLHTIAGKEVREAIVSSSNMVRDLENITKSFATIIGDTSVQHNLKRIIFHFRDVNPNEVMQFTHQIYTKIQTDMSSDRSVATLDALIELTREVSATMHSAREKIDVNELHHAAKELITLLDTFNKVSSMLSPND